MVAILDKRVLVKRYENLEVKPEELKGKICYGGLDLSTTSDISAFALIFPVDDNYKVDAQSMFPTITYSYQDIHADRDKAMLWLRQEASQYRGRNEGFNSVNG